MAEIRFNAFLSCSQASEDKEVVDFFERLISSFDIEPEIYDYQEIGTVPDKVRERISSSDCLIAIATRRKKIEGSDLWACPDWIHHEIALANAFQKPIAIFYEEGVKLEGLIGMEERREKFSRDNLLSNVDKITKFLFKLRAYLESTERLERKQEPVLLRHHLRVKEKMTRELIVERCEILMECLTDELEATHHSTELEETTPGLSVQPEEFDFMCKEKPSGTRVNTEVVQTSPRKHLWRINFDPPIQKGDKISYAYKLVRPNTRPFTFEEVKDRINQGTYEYEDPICEACEWSITYPTALFRYETEFPEGYEIQNCYVDVKRGEAELKAKKELERIKKGNMFSAEEMVDTWSMHLKVAQPVQNHIYYVYYTPPTEE